MKNVQTAINKQPFLFLLLIPCISMVMHWRIFTTDLMGIHLWRQSQTEINIQNFYRHDFNIMNPRNNSVNGGSDNIKRFEFPIMQWLVAVPHKIFGESIAITRISMFFIGLWGVLGMFFLIKYLFKDTFSAVVGAWIFNFSPLFYYYTMNPLPDVFALCSSLWAMAFFFKFYETEKNRDALLSAFFLSLATLAKLPYVIFGAMVGAYILIQLFKNGTKTIKPSLKLAAFYVVLLLPAFFWYKWVIPTWGENGVLKGVLDNKIPLSKSIEILKFHYEQTLHYLLLTKAGIPFFVLGIFFMLKNKILKTEKGLMMAATGLAVIAYFLFEINMIDIVHDYYMMPFLAVLPIITTYGFKKIYPLHWTTQILSFLLICALPVLAFRAVNNYWSIEKSYINSDLILYKDELRRLVPNDEKCIILNDVSNYIFSYQIDKQGHIFQNDDLPMPWIEDMIKRFNVRYMYSDSRKVDGNPEFKAFVESTIFERGTIKVFKFKPLK